MMIMSKRTLSFGSMRVGVHRENFGFSGWLLCVAFEVRASAEPSSLSTPCILADQSSGPVEVVGDAEQAGADIK